MNKIVVIGQNSRLSKVLLSLSDNSISVPKEIYVNWKNENVLSELVLTFEGSTVFITKGVLNRQENLANIMDWNYSFPRLIIDEIIRSDVKCNVVTFGSIHELTSIDNPYLNSKRKLSSYVNLIERPNVKHFRLHTIFGEGLPVSHMFIGQIYSSLKTGTLFQMTAGAQLRQYHDYETLASHVLKSVKNLESLPSCYNVNGPYWISLREIAVAVFREFSKEELLRINELSIPSNEVMDVDKSLLTTCNFDEPIPLLLDYFKKLLK